jgi:hypothetical protein
MRRAALILLIVVFWAGTALGQSVISAKSGTIHYVEGSVLLNGKAVEPKFGNFPQIQENSELQTGVGRAEVLLGPGVLLWVGENSALRMISDRLTDTRLEVRGGEVLVECAELLDGAEMTFLVKDATVSIAKDGVYLIDYGRNEVRVYQGEAEVAVAGQTHRVKKERLLALTAVAMPEKFDSKKGDSLFRWARRRSEYLAMANVSAAKYVRDNGTMWNRSGWVWNPYFGMFTYIPHSGFYRSFWGNWGFWSPYDVYMVYQPRPVVSGPDYGGGGMHAGYQTVPSTSVGTSGTVAASPPATSSAAPAAAPISRETGNAGGRSR